MKALQLPPPSNWQDFEKLCLDIFVKHWGDPGCQLFGRSGQEQHGIDILGTHKGKAAAVQCKLRDVHAGAIKPEEIRKDLLSAAKLKPDLHHVIIATTARRDKSIQLLAKQAKAEWRVPFEVSIWSWDDIADFALNQPDILAKHYSWLGLGEPSGSNIRAYLESLYNRLDSLPMLCLRGASGPAPALASVYTDISIVSDALKPYSGSRSAGDNPYLAKLQQHVVERSRIKVRKDILHKSRMSAIELLAAHRHVVIAGLPGSGKSTLLKYVGLCLMGDRLGSKPASIGAMVEHCAMPPNESWPHGALIPFFAELRDVAASMQSSGERAPTCESLVDYLLVSSPFAASMHPDLIAWFRSTLLAKQRGDGLMLLLDGLDEIPDDLRMRDWLLHAIAQFCIAYPQARVAITARPYAVPSSSGALSGFVVEELAPLDGQQVEKFVRGWYAMVAGEGNGSRVDDLLACLESDLTLKPLSERPLLLTMLTDLHAGGEAIRGGRARLFQRSTELLFDKWNLHKAAVGSETFAQRYGMTNDQVMDALRRVAFRVHGEGGRAADAAPIEIKVLWEAFGLVRPQQATVDERRLLHYLQQRSGIIIDLGSSLYRFVHRSFQEYLAAIHLNKSPDFPEELRCVAAQDPSLWREVIIFSFLDAAERQTLAWNMLDVLLPSDPVSEPDTNRALVAIALASALVESQLLKDAVAKRKVAILRIKMWMEHAIRMKGLSAVDRGHAGDALGWLGDARIAEARQELLEQARNRPGEPVIGRFPVTVNEFLEFIGSKDVQDGRWWDSGVGRVPQMQGLVRQSLFPSRPIVGIAHEDALAFCRWLAAQCGEKFTGRLPTVLEMLTISKSIPRPTSEADVAVRRWSSVGTRFIDVGARWCDVYGNVFEWCIDGSAATKEGSGKSMLVFGGSAKDLEEIEKGTYYAAPSELRSLAIGFRVCLSWREE